MNSNQLRGKTDVGSNLFIAVLLCLVVLFCSSSCTYQHSPLFELKKDTGIDFNNKLNPDPELNILTYLYYYNGGGVASGDFNNDGFIDLYFTGNQVADRLYLNAGALHFMDITNESGIVNDSGWTTGVTVVDINHDGLLDIYVCKVGQFKSISGQNLLFVNQGINLDGIPEFKEEAAKYHLDVTSFATQAAFFDYDIDGDLDMFLLNHSVYPNRTYGKGSSRQRMDSLAGDQLFENREGVYFDVSKTSGIFQGKIGYGLGIGISDLNNDGYPDIYIGNDFFENDYLYLNQKDGTFKELITADQTHVGHTSHFSMGNDIADINNDGWTDIISLDMLPENLKAYKTSGREYNNAIYDQYLNNGYRPQYMQNSLLRNGRGKFFQETAFAAGLAATDWSWAPLIVDLDNDGYKDVFISNGIIGATNDMDFINFIADKKIQKQLEQGMEEKDLKFTEQLPQRKLSNYFFKNRDGIRFSNQTANWFQELPSFSNGSIYADLDNDGDQDLVVSNVNEKAFILENKSDKGANNSIQIILKGPNKNTLGIGSKIAVFSDSLSIFMENYSSRGYLSAMASEMTVGIGPRNAVDSIRIHWPGGSTQLLTNIAANTKVTFDYQKASLLPLKTKLPTIALKPVAISSEARHQEPTSYEFGREPLIPYSKGTEGPKISVADINNDGLEDFYLGGGKRQASSIYLQDGEGNFKESSQPEFTLVKDNEETDNVLFDADNDGDLDLLAVSGGNEYIGGKELHPQLFMNEQGIFTLNMNFPEIEVNASVVKAADIDSDGDMDLIIGANAFPRKFGRPATNYLLLNDGSGNFNIDKTDGADSFAQAGLVEDLAFSDVNADGLKDLIVLGHWMPISIFLNSKQGFKRAEYKGLNKSNGLWNRIAVADFDKDGDLDFIAGNWGLNTRLRASSSEPMQLYISDFDLNGKEESIMTYFDQGEKTVFSSKDELTKQLPSLNKKFLSYADFAAADFKELFNKKIIDKAQLLEVYELSSCYFENIGDAAFKKHKLPFTSQLSSVKSIHLDDFNKDGFTDVLLAGNDFHINTQLSRLDASHGELLINDTRGNFFSDQKADLDLRGMVRDISSIRIQGETYLIVTFNNDSPVFLKATKTHDSTSN